MLTGKPPFKGASRDDLYSNILRGKLVWPSYLSIEAKDLISLLLDPIPEKRLRLNEIEQHPWFESLRPKRKQSYLYTMTKSIYTDSTSSSSFISQVKRG